MFEVYDTLSLCLGLCVVFEIRFFFWRLGHYQNIKNTHNNLAVHCIVSITLKKKKKTVLRVQRISQCYATDNK